MAKVHLIASNLRDDEKERIAMEVSQEAFERFQAATKTAQERIAELVLDLKKAEVRLKTNTELLRQSNGDIKLLLAFIKSKRLQPPKIQSGFVT